MGVSTGVPLANGTHSSLDTRYSEENTIIVIVALFGSLTAILVSVFNVLKHLANYTKPELQKPIVRILFIVPFYAIFSFLGLVMPENGPYFEAIRDIYEAFVIHVFLNLIITYCGGEAQTIAVISKKPGSISHIWPVNYCLPRMQLTSGFLRFCKRLTLQFVFVKPIMSIVHCVMVATKNNTKPVYSMSQLIIYNISYSLALYGLVLIYMATHHHPGLSSRRPLFKFASIKLIVFATYYQALLVQLTPGIDRHTLEFINNFILCWEMVGFAFMHVVAFGWREFRVDVRVGDYGGMGGPEPEDFDDEVPQIANSTLHLDLNAARLDREAKDAIRNIRDAVNLKDVVTETMVNFDERKYGGHVMLDTKDPGVVDHGHHSDDEESDNPFEQFRSQPPNNLSNDVALRSKEDKDAAKAATNPFQMEVL